MASVELRGVEEAQQMLAALKGQIPYATSVALNAVGKDVLAAQKSEMQSVFDQPTTYTLGSLFQTGATKAKPETRTRMKKGKKGSKADPHGETSYIGTQIFGGERRDKASEKKLRTYRLLPDGYQMVPGAGLKLNQYGNVSGARVAAILRTLLGISRVVRGSKGAGVNTGSYTKAGGTFVVGEVGGTKGIWKIKSKKRWIPIFIFVKTPDYSRLLDYHGVSEAEFRKKWKSAYSAAIDKALATAR